MPNQSLSLATFYSGWGVFQRNLMEMIAPLSREQLARPTVADHWTIAQVVQHLAANRVWWFQVWMGEGDAALAPIAHWDPQDEAYQPPSEPSELAAGLEASWRMIADALARWTPADLGRTFAAPEVMSEEERRMFGGKTRQWIIWHVLEHELLHTGELSLALGSYGLPGIYGDL